MKNRLILFLFFSLFTFLGFSQDLIITNENDSIQCKIIKVKNDILIYKSFYSFHYSQKLMEMSLIKDTLINFHVQNIKDTDELRKIHTHKIITRVDDTIYCKLIQNRDTYSVFSETINNEEITKGLPSYEIKEIQKIKIPKIEGKDAYEISFFGGYAVRTGSKPITNDSGEKKLIEELYKGSFININTSYVVKNTYGIGVYYNRFATKGSGSIQYTDGEETIDISIELKNILISYGLNGAYYFNSDDQKFRFGMHLGLGGVSYKEEGNIGGVYMLTKGSSLSTTFGIDLSYFISQKVALSLSSRVITGNLKSVDYTLGSEYQKINLGKENKYNISHFQIGIGIIAKL